jgi:hypothetical protein
MFDLSKEPILTSLPRACGMWVLAAVTSFTIGACWNGSAADGLPCTDDAQCGLGKSCIDGYCAGVFICGDGTQIDAVDVCDVDIDCEDASDEDVDMCGGGGANVNQCEEPDGDLAYQLGAAVTGSANALKVVAADVQGMPSPDAISASQGGTEVLIEFDLDIEPKEFVLGPFGDRAVAGFEIADASGDGKDDVIVFAVGSDIAIYVYQNMSPMPPQQFGMVGIVPNIPDYQPRGVEVGQLDAGNAADIVGIADIGPAHGVLLTALGDPASAAGGQAYFGDPVQSAPIGYDQFVDSALADVDGDGLDDLVVTGVDAGGPGLWFVHRTGGDLAGWADAMKIPVMAPGLLAVGRFMGSPPPGVPIGNWPDLAILDPMNGRIQTMVNMGGMLTPGFSTTLDGSGFTGLSLADMNCDGQGDFVFALTDPTEIRVLFGDGQGGAMSNVPLVYADPGTPRGGLDIALLDNDSTPDIFTAADPGDDPMDEPTVPQVRVLVTGQ